MISTVSILGHLTGMGGGQNHHLETVSTPPQDFGARGARMQEPSSYAHPIRGHPLGASLYLKGMMAKGVQLFKA